MRLALQVAMRGRGRTSPNPMVGAVIVSPGGVVVGTGWHQRAGEAHAEIAALLEAGDEARGATLYCTLEPCCHQGRTGPCVGPIVAAGIARVVTATEDPNPLVLGGGIRYLRAHGVDVEVGPCARDARRLNEAFFMAVTRHRPFVTAKIALSADAAVADAPGRRTRLSGPIVDRLMQRQRAEVDAIGVGANTVVVDDPLLTARGVYRHRPLVRVIFDARLRVPPSARVFGTLAQGPCYLVADEAACAAAPEAVRRFADGGVGILQTRRCDFRSALDALHGLQVRSLLLEGGPILHRTALAAGLVDKLQIIVTPHRLGPGAVRWLDSDECSLAALHDLTVAVHGDDVVIEGYVHRAD
jgi:diaminohydroxyphosphoribosylaminopyrimidine deaminase/5-amino-6-(5-phosphoribosylamino)uracil reductase